MRNVIRRFWVVLPILASTATQCDETPRGAVPSPVASVEIVLESVPEPTPPASDVAFATCLQRMDRLPNHLRPSWRANNVDTEGVAILLVETAPNRWVLSFNDVPVNALNLMSVHDTNECARNPDGQGHVTMGVSANGTAVTTVLPDDVLAFQVDEAGVVQAPMLLPSP